MRILLTETQTVMHILTKMQTVTHILLTETQTLSKQSCTSSQKPKLCTHNLASPSNWNTNLVRRVMYFLLSETQNSSRKTWTSFTLKHKTHPDSLTSPSQCQWNTKLSKENMDFLLTEKAVRSFPRMTHELQPQSRIILPQSCAPHMSTPSPHHVRCYSLPQCLFVFL